MKGRASPVVAGALMILVISSCRQRNHAPQFERPNLPPAAPAAPTSAPATAPPTPFSAKPTGRQKATVPRKEAEQLLATLINLNGMLCAEVISVTPLRTRDRYEVECIEYRGGRHRATYVVDVSRGAVEKL